MKKTKIIGIVALMGVFAVMSLGSGSSEPSSNQKEIVADDNSTSSDDADQTDETTAEETAGQSSQNAVTIDEQVLIESDDIKITAMSYEVDSIWGDGIKLLIENNGSKDLGVGMDALIVNDYMITDLFASTVAAGKKANETVSLLSTELKNSGIENVGKIEMYFHTYDPDTYSTLENYDCVTIKTSAYDHMDTAPNDTGQELYNDNGIRIVGKYVNEDSIWGTAILLYIENNSGANKIIQCDDLSINGFMLTPFFSSTVYNEKKAISEITLLSSELEENGITSVEDVELKFKIIDEDFMNSIETDVISFSAK